MSTVYDCSQTDSRTAGLAAAKNALKAGRLVVLPTDTLYGLAADMDPILAFAKEHRLPVIEDNAQAIGAAGPGFKIGQLSDVATTSFIIQKNLGTFGDPQQNLTHPWKDALLPHA